MINFRLLLLIGILTGLLVACSGAQNTPTPSEEVLPPTAEPVAVIPTDTPELVEPSPTAEPVEPEPTMAPTEEPAAVMPADTPEVIAMVEFEGDECLTCHTDKDRLIENTALVEEAPSESSGVG
jgi:hypothetical protein